MTTQTTTPMTNLYDVLDVEPTGSPDEIRAAWRAAVAELDPTDRRFRVYNQAAEVLLDPERRDAYDAAEQRRTGRPESEASLLASTQSTVATIQSSLATRRGGVPGWLIVAVAAVTAILLGYVGVALAQPSDASVRPTPTPRRPRRSRRSCRSCPTTRTPSTGARRRPPR